MRCTAPLLRIRESKPSPPGGDGCLEHTTCWAPLYCLILSLQQPHELGRIKGRLSSKTQVWLLRLGRLHAVPVPGAALPWHSELWGTVWGPGMGVLALGTGQCCPVVGSGQVLSTALLTVLMDLLSSPSYVSWSKRPRWIFQ